MYTPKTTTLTFTEDEWAGILSNARYKRISRKQFINALCDLGWSRKSAKEEVRKINGHYGAALADYELDAKLAQQSLTHEKLLQRLSL